MARLTEPHGYRSNWRDVVVVAFANQLLKLATKGYRAELRKVLMGGFAQAMSRQGLEKEVWISQSLASEMRRLEDLVDEVKEHGSSECHRANVAEAKIEKIKELRDELRESSKDWHWHNFYRQSWANIARKLSVVLDD